MEASDTPVRWTWTDEEVVLVMTAQDYVARCEHRIPGFASLKAFVDPWSEARVRHGIAKDAASVDRARARLIQIAREICSIMGETHVAGPGAVGTDAMDEPPATPQGPPKPPRRGRVQPLIRPGSDPA
jgi:hypothetical protein